jgi:ABC-type sugar transport system permease subunit
MWISLIVYGVWHAAPFAFVIFYAGLQTLPADQLEAAQIDGATRTQQVRYVVLPHLMPLVSFVALIQLMDNFRVFEPIVGFNASAHSTYDNRCNNFATTCLEKNLARFYGES